MNTHWFGREPEREVAGVMFDEAIERRAMNAQWRLEAEP
jgi:hypothetical protein